jgi:hypothetical protein
MHMNSATVSPFRPVGYWLRLLDQLIEEALDATLRRLSLNRRDWQALNLAASGPVTLTTVEAELAAFESANGSVEATVNGLIERGWIEAHGDELVLTSAALPRLEGARAAVKQARDRTSAGVARSDYDTTIATLETMCRNLGWVDQRDE